MINKIDKDQTRFRKIVRGKIREDLKKYISHGEMIARKGRNIVSIPMPQIEIPHFKYDHRQTGGVGQGEGDQGTPIGSEDGDGGPGEAGDAPGQHILEVDITLEELAKILGEELELPNIEPRGTKNIQAERDKYSSIRRSGPESLRHFKRTYRAALRRQITAGLYDPKRPMVLPIREDRRYRSWRTIAKPQSNAVIIYMMDVSGSMGGEQKEIVRIEAFWIDTWLRSQYKNLTTRYIVHDAAAHEVDEETFFKIRESGGTRISSAYSLCKKIIDAKFDPTEWNIYPFHFSDGDNWGSDDTERCVKILGEDLFPIVNMFCYGQVRSAYGSGKFIKDLQEHFEDEEALTTSEIESKDGIMDSIKTFLGKGK